MASGGHRTNALSAHLSHRFVHAIFCCRHSLTVRDTNNSEIASRIDMSDRAFAFQARCQRFSTEAGRRPHRCWPAAGSPRWVS